MHQQKTDTNNHGIRWIVAGCIFAAIGIVSGSIGAHGLEDMLSSEFQDIPKRLKNWDTAVRYQMYHSLGLVLLGILANSTRPNRLFTMAGWMMVAGVALFSGCLYGWCLLDIKPLVHIVPFGGLAFIVAWVVLAFGAYRSTTSGTQS